MILPVNNINRKTGFTADNGEQKGVEYTHDTLLKNSYANRAKIGVDKFINAFTVYPAKGMKGSKNANFYEFLTMGTIPYLVGSGMLMAIFNGVNKYYPPFHRVMSKQTGNKLALGVVFYGIMKNISKDFITKPVKMLTGVDTEQPYAKVIYELPEDINDTDITSIEHHKVFESVEFPRWDLLYNNESNGKPRNEYYDKIAKKLGLGENLKDSDQEVKPRIKEIVVKSNMAKNISSYLWAAVGVALAAQEPWENFFNVFTLKFWKGKDFLNSVKSFGRNFVKASKELWQGSGSGLKKQSGKILIGLAVLSSVLGVANAVISPKSKLKSSDVIDKSKGYLVS